MVLKLFPVFCWLLLVPMSLFSAATALQMLSFSIFSSSKISTSGNPKSLTVFLNSSGFGSSEDKSTTYSISSNQRGHGTLKIVGAISSGSPMPSNTQLKIFLSSKKGVSQGAQPLSSGPVDLVTQLPLNVSDTGTITYTFEVKNGWTIPSQTIQKFVTLTLTSGS